MIFDIKIKVNMGFSNEIELKKYLSPVFFETGTFLGGGTRMAARSGFKKIITIELQEYLYNQCINGDPNGNGEDLVDELRDGLVEMHLGDTRSLMWDIIKDIDSRITFWLDAHIDDGNYRHGVTPYIAPCPLYEEIDIIARHSRKDHIIMIDDLRIIGVEGWGNGIDINLIKNKILNINPNYQFIFEDGHQKGDILVAYVNNPLYNILGYGRH